MGKKVMIGVHGQWGDIATALSVIKYKNELWGDNCKITWFASKENWDAFKFQDIDVREFPRGFGYPEMVEVENKKLIEKGEEPVWQDWQSLVDENNHLNLELAKNYPSLAEFDFGYWPAPHQMSVRQRNGLSYPECSKKVFGIPSHYAWHPVLEFSDEEREMVKEFMDALPNRYNIMCETFGGSGQTFLTEQMVKKAIEVCRQELGECNFIFASHKFLRDDEKFPEWLLNEDGFVSIAHLTVRQTALVNDFCDMMICVSSGISVATSCWGARPVPKIQYCGSWVCGTSELSNGIIQGVYTEDKYLPQAENEFYETLKQLLNHIK